MLKNQNKKKTRFYSLIAVLLTSCLILSVAASVALSQTINQKPSDQSDQTINASPLPSSIPDTNATNTDSITTNATEIISNSSSKSALLTKDEALKIAMPLIEKYASENGRVISSVNATFCTGYDTDGTRGGSAYTGSSDDSAGIMAAFQNAPSYPA